MNAKQQRFVQEYLIDLNATAAYRRAGYKPKTPESAENAASRLLGNVGVAAAIREAIEARKARTEIEADGVLRQLARIVHADPRKLFRPDGTLKAVTELDDDTAAALAGFEVFEDFAGSGKARRRVGLTTRPKLWGKVEAIRLALLHLGLLNEQAPPAGPPVIFQFTPADRAGLRGEALPDADPHPATAPG